VVQFSEETINNQPVRVYGLYRDRVMYLNAVAFGSLRDQFQVFYFYHLAINNWYYNLGQIPNFPTTELVREGLNCML